MGDVLYQLVDDVLMRKEVEECTKVDLHLHSKYSSREPYPDESGRRGIRFIDTKTTRWLEVLECYTPLDEIYRVNRAAGMTFDTLSDHMVVDGALEYRRRYPNVSFVSCEYTGRFDIANDVRLDMLVSGLDYADGVTRPAADRTVQKIHNDLMGLKDDPEAFSRFCGKRGIPVTLCHVFGPVKTILSGAQVDYFTDIFSRIEMNGDMPGLTNIKAFEVAREKNLIAKEEGGLGKILVTGNDAHTPIRIGEKYTAVDRYQERPHEFIEALRDQRVFIGSSMKVPEWLNQDSVDEIITYLFSNDKKGLRRDTWFGFRRYFTSDFRFSKVRKVIGPGILIPTTLGTILGLASISLGIGVGLGVLGLGAAYAAIKGYNIPSNEMEYLVYATEKAYRDYRSYRFLKETEKERDGIARLSRAIQALEKRREPLERTVAQVKKTHEDLANHLPETLKKPSRFERLIRILGPKKFGRDV